MSPRKYRKDTFMIKNEKVEAKQRHVSKMDRETQVFSKKMKKGFRVRFIDLWIFKRPTHAQGFIVSMDKELPIKEIMQRLHDGFGDLGYELEREN